MFKRWFSHSLNVYPTFFCVFFPLVSWLVIPWTTLICCILSSSLPLKTWTSAVPEIFFSAYEEVFWLKSTQISSLRHVQLFCNPADLSPPGSSSHEISQARILENLLHLLNCMQILYHCTTYKVRVATVVFDPKNRCACMSETEVKSFFLQTLGNQHEIGFISWFSSPVRTSILSIEKQCLCWFNIC